MGKRFSMELDPMKDGFVGTIEKAESTAGRYAVIGTNYAHRFISEKQFNAYTDELSKKDTMGLLMTGSFMVFYDTTKLIEIDGESYFVGSVLVVEPANENEAPHAYSWMDDSDIEEAKEDLSDYLTELIIDGERYDALHVD
nr:hypothetical protein [uncultured Butyrivibrio sp.]